MSKRGDGLLEWLSMFIDEPQMYLLATSFRFHNVERRSSRFGRIFEVNAN
jgi:hypothetical protein